MAEVVRRGAFGLVCVLSLVVLFAPQSDIPTSIDINDKVIHAALFAALAATGLLAGLPVVPLGVGLLVYAGASEVLQAELPINRDGDVLDALADLGGIVVGLVLGSLSRARSSGPPAPTVAP